MDKCYQSVSLEIRELSLLLNLLRSRNLHIKLKAIHEPTAKELQAKLETLRISDFE